MEYSNLFTIMDKKSNGDPALSRQGLTTDPSFLQKRISRSTITRVCQVTQNGRAM